MIETGPASSAAPDSNGHRGALKGSSHRRMIELDFLRGIAIMLVLFAHSYNFPWSLDEMGFPGRIGAPLIRFGWTGVDLFFVLSGFLVGGLLFQEIQKTGKLNAGRFLIRRGLKIWPGYYVFIAFCAVKIWHHGCSALVVLRALGPNLVHLQNYLAHPSPWPEPTWSLAVEEHFYLALPLLFLFLVHGSEDRSRLSVIPWITLCLLVVCLTLRILYCNASTGSSLFPTHIRIDTLFVGVCISYFYHFHSESFLKLRRWRLAICIAGLAMILPMFIVNRTDRFAFTLGYTLLAFGYGCILISVVPYKGEPADPTGFWLTRPARLVGWVGVYSYSIYLWHMDVGVSPVYCWLSPLWRSLPRGWQWLPCVALIIPMSVLGGAAMAKLVEFPALRLRDRLFPSLAVPSTHRGQQASLDAPVVASSL